MDTDVQTVNPFGNDGPTLVPKDDFHEEAKKVVVLVRWFVAFACTSVSLSFFLCVRPDSQHVEGEEAYAVKREGLPDGGVVASPRGRVLVDRSPAGASPAESTSSSSSSSSDEATKAIEKDIVNYLGTTEDGSADDGAD